MQEESLPLIVRKRIEVSKIFYPLNRNEERKWARIFHNGFDALVEKLEPFAKEMEFDQKSVKGHYILWKYPVAGTHECMFCLISDAMSFQQVRAVFDLIEKFDPTFAYAILHQQKDGEGTYDIFRFSKFSYLEHCNRVKVPKPRK